METLPPINHIFIDFENVHEVDLSLVGEKLVDLTLLLGPNHKKLDAELVEKMLQHANSVHLVRLTEPGSNALDFALAYYVGHAAALDPSGFFQIISGDKGYDPLIAHLRRNHVKACRHPDFESLKNRLNPPTATPAIVATSTLKAKPEPKPTAPTTPSSASTSLEAHATHSLERLRNPKNRPAKRTTLVRHIRTLAGNKINEAEAFAVIETLRSAGHITITEKGAVTYNV